MKEFKVEYSGYRERVERRREKGVRVVRKTQISLQTVQILRALIFLKREPEHTNWEPALPSRAAMDQKWAGIRIPVVVFH